MAAVEAVAQRGLGMATAETNIMNAALVALSAAGALVWRQNTGAYRDKAGRLIRYGLCTGSADIIGIAPDGRFLAVEIKTAMGQPTDAQVAFIAAVRRAGGRAGIARSGAEAVAIAVAPLD